MQNAQYLRSLSEMQKQEHNKQVTQFSCFSCRDYCISKTVWYIMYMVYMGIWRILRVSDSMGTNCTHPLTGSSDHRPSLVILHVFSGTSSLISIGYGSGNSKNVGICAQCIVKYVSYAH